MRVAAIVNLFPTPTEGFVRDQLDELRRRGHDLSLFALSRGEGDRGEWSPSYASHDWTAAIRRLTVEPGPAAIVSALAKSLRRRTLQEFSRDAASLLIPHTFGPAFEPNAFDLVHCHFGHVGAEAAERWLDADKPLVVSFYGFDAFRLPRLWDPRPYRRLFRRADSVLSLGPWMDEALIRLGCPVSRLRRMSFPIDLSRYRRSPRPTPGTEPRWLIAARLVEKKGIDDGIRAAARLADSLDSPVRLRIAGAGPLEGSLRSLARRQPKLRVEFLGGLTRERVREEIEASDGVLVPSRPSISGDDEGTPVVVLEAMAVGRPVVATSTGDLPLLLDSLRGSVVDPGDTAALAREMESAVTFGEAWTEKLENARRFVEDRHSLESYGDFIEAVYRSAAGIHEPLLRGHSAQHSTRPADRLVP